MKYHALCNLTKIEPKQSTTGTEAEANFYFCNDHQVKVHKCFWQVGEHGGTKSPRLRSLKLKKRDVSPVFGTDFRNNPYSNKLSDSVGN